MKKYFGRETDADKARKIVDNFKSQQNSGQNTGNQTPNGKANSRQARKGR